MKKVIMNEELESVMEEGVNLLCNTVSQTLGPTGNNILINNSETTPYITNDGVTIANNIESEDERINTILELLKESSMKTDELVGDGTTTTLVLLQSIFNQGLELIKKGKNKVLLKNELLSCMNLVVELIKKEKKPPKKEDYYKIALTSSNDKEIAKTITEVYHKMKNKFSIKLEESSQEKTYTIHKNGYHVGIKNLSSMYFSKNNQIELNNVHLYLLKGYLDSLESISNIINDAITFNKNILIFTEAMNEEIKNELLVYYFQNHHIFITELEESFSFREKQEEDIKILSKATMKNIDYEEVTCNDSGYIANIIIEKEEITISNPPENAKELIQKLKKEYRNSYNDYEKEFLASRISQLEKGITTIYVGGVTKTEKREKIMRYIDALSSLETAKEGITIGEGITYLKVASEIKENSDGERMIKKALEKPFEKILENLGYNSKLIKEEIIKNNYQIIYDYKDNKCIPLEKNEVIDPILVLITAFKNALSISSLLLSTSSLVINIEKETDKNIL